MALLEKAEITEDLGVSIRALLLAKGGHNIDKAPVVLHTPLGPARLLLLLGHLGSLTSHFPSTGQGTMDFTCSGKGGQQAVRTRRHHGAKSFLPQLKVLKARWAQEEMKTKS